MIVVTNVGIGVHTDDSPSRVTQDLMRHGSCEVFAVKVIENGVLVAENTPVTLFAHAVTLIVKDSSGE